MIEYKKLKYRNKPNRMSDTEIVVILFHSDVFQKFKHYYKEYIHKHLKGLFKELSEHEKHSMG